MAEFRFKRRVHRCRGLPFPTMLVGLHLHGLGIQLPRERCFAPAPARMGPDKRLRLLAFAISPPPLLRRISDLVQPVAGGCGKRPQLEGLLLRSTAPEHEPAVVVLNKI